MKSEQKLNLKKNQEISLTIEDFTKEGEGLGKYQGFPFFVKDTVIGDEVRVSITKLKKNYGYARLVEKGNTVIVIEHNLDVIKMADYIIDMGPEGGRGGGQLLSCGTPEEVAKSDKGYTPRFIKEELENQ